MAWHKPFGYSDHMNGYQSGGFELREAAERIWSAAIAGAAADRLVREAVIREGDRLRVGGREFDLGAAERVFVVAFGKAAVPMAGELARLLGDMIAGGVVVPPAGAPAASVHPRLEMMPAAHPLPDARSVAAARRALQIVHAAGEKDLVFVLISGGGSSLLCLPAEGVTLEDKAGLTSTLLRAGATIRELNTVRKHLSGIKGGRLAAAARPAPLVSLVISDVVGDDLGTIASGPTHWDGTTFADARAVLEKYDLWDGAPEGVRKALRDGEAGRVAETLRPEDPAFAHASTFVIGNNRSALDAARGEAERLGFETLVLTDADEGEARTAARRYLSFLDAFVCSLARPLCLLAGGELTVTVSGQGLGGRNTEFVLAALEDIAAGRSAEGLSAGFDRRAPDWLVASVGTDGRDGPTDAAGAWADAGLLVRSREAGLAASAFLKRNDAYRFFESTGGLVVTGPTGTNVMDIRVFLLRPAAGA